MSTTTATNVRNLDANRIATSMLREGCRLFWNDLPTAPITAAEACAAYVRGELSLACRHRPDSVILVVKTSMLGSNSRMPA